MDNLIMEWIKSVLASLLQHGDFVMGLLSIACLLGVIYFLEQTFPEVTIKQKLIVFVLIIGYGFCEVFGYSFRHTVKEQKEAQNASFLTFTMTAPEGEERVQIQTKMSLSENVPEWGNDILKELNDGFRESYTVKETE